MTQVVKETVVVETEKEVEKVVEKEVEKVVKETVVVEKEVEKVVTPTPVPPPPGTIAKVPRHRTLIMAGLGHLRTPSRAPIARLEEDDD